MLGDVPHQKTGATALHVAAAKGYIKVISLLIQAGAQVNTQVLPSITHFYLNSLKKGIFCELCSVQYTELKAQVRREVKMFLPVISWPPVSGSIILNYESGSGSSH